MKSARGILSFCIALAVLGVAVLVQALVGYLLKTEGPQYMPAFLAIWGLIYLLMKDSER